jgi:tetratricopeptide (TPR) repeat protein
MKLEEGYRHIGEAIRLRGWDEEETNIFKAVYDWLCDEANGRWVMILDNADDINVFTTAAPCGTKTARDNSSASTAMLQIRSFLPNSSIGSILITSRDKQVAFEITGNSNHYLHLDVMDEDEAVLLFKKKVRGNHKDEDMIELVKTLDYSPLAISQAAAYISRRTPSVTVASYTEMARKSNENVLQPLEESVHESHRDPERSNSIIATLQISFQYVDQTSPAAARLLSLICMFDRQWIPDLLLREGYGEEEIFPFPVSWWKRKKSSYDRKRRARKAKEKRATKIDFENDWATLTDLSIIKINADGSSFSMHRLTQLAIKRWLVSKHELEVWAIRLITIMAMWFPRQIDNIDGGWLLFKHAEQVAAYPPSNVEVACVWVSLMKRTTDFISARGYWASAGELSKILLTETKKYGMKEELILQYAEQRADILAHLDKWDEAEQLYRQIIEQRTKDLGPHHKDTCNSMKSLEQMLSEKAKKEGIVIKKTINDLDLSPSFKQTSSALAGAFHHMDRGEYQEAEKAIRDVYSIGRRVHGSWDYNARWQTDILAFVIQSQGRYAEAEALYREILAEVVSDGDPPVSLDVADMLEKQGKDEEAEYMYREILRFIKNHAEFEANQDAALRPTASLAHVLLKRGAFDEAEELSRRVTETRKKDTGHTIGGSIAHHTLAVIMDRQEQFEKALHHYKIAYEGMAKEIGAHHPTTKVFLKDYTTAKKKVGDCSALPNIGPDASCNPQ